VPDLRAAVDPLYHEAHPATAILGAARALARVLEDGDAVASRIVAVGADELARAAATVARALRLEEIFLAGGAFAAIPALENAARARLAAVLPQARVETSRVDPVRGAARIAALAAWDEPV
jgi:N-acetylglucosamine kinase-like BadF-type ATPase